MARRLWAMLLALALLSAAGAPLWADQPDRPVPDYDGREPAPATAGEKALWAPRIVFFPIYLVTNYVIRTPLGAFLTWLEREHIIEKIGGVFTFGPEGDVGLFPTALWEFNFRPSVGFFFFSNGTFADDDAFRIHFAWGGDDWWRFTVRERIPFEPSPRLRDFEVQDQERQNPEGVENDAAEGGELNFAFVLDFRPDHLFFGIGPDSVADEDYRYTRNRFGGEIGIAAGFGQYDGLRLDLAFMRNKLGHGDFSDDGDAVVEFPDAPGFTRGERDYTLGSAEVALYADSRAPRPEPGTGVRGEVFARFARDFSGRDLTFVGYGGAVSGFVDVTGRQRVLSLRHEMRTIHSLGDEAVPVPELYTNDQTTLRGLQPGRYRGQSLVSTHLQWSYPIWVFMDGFVFADVGNAFGENFEGFDLGDYVMSFGGGFRSNGDRNIGFELRAGAGTVRFGDNRFFEVDQVYFGFGAVGGL